MYDQNVKVEVGDELIAFNCPICKKECGGPKRLKRLILNCPPPKSDLKPFVLKVAETETIVLCDDVALQIPEPDKDDHSLVVKT